MMKSVAPVTAIAKARLSRRKFATTLAALGVASVARGVRAQTQAPASLERLSAVATAELEELTRWTQAQGAKVSGCICDAFTGRELASTFGHQPLNPASNQKLLTMAVALERLGPDYRFSTSLHGRANGDSLSELVLRGDGDPELSLDDLAHLVRALRGQGFQRITGDLLVDQSAFDRVWDPPAYAQHPSSSLMPISRSASRCAAAFHRPFRSSASAVDSASHATAIPHAECGASSFFSELKTSFS